MLDTYRFNGFNVLLCTYPVYYMLIYLMCNNVTETLIIFKITSPRSLPSLKNTKKEYTLIISGHPNKEHTFGKKEYRMVILSKDKQLSNEQKLSLLFHANF